eukprot:gnl/MRDRNA2_/MRDRNA2_15888_c0_seq1.p1 gnl/MRDRNA2_/MRDRNA2_15888_c0~~gnl/MRDRNA2_/MRDRNA2_15888_c0_seq1.p1  ORF type:complete len:461 (+),score=64.76 gnl/MRDRNA2_/MRDRNA2_15888_c0_seq1:57-1385(+)
MSIPQIVRERARALADDNAPPCLVETAEQQPRCFCAGYFAVAILICTLSIVVLYKLWSQPLEALTKEYEEAHCLVRWTAVDSIICPEDIAQTSCYVAKVGVVVVAQNHTEITVMKPHSVNEAPFAVSADAETYVSRFMKGYTYPCWQHGSTEDVLLEPYEPPSALAALWFPVLVMLVIGGFAICLCYMVCSGVPVSKPTTTRAAGLGKETGYQQTLASEFNDQGREEGTRSEHWLDLLIPLALVVLVAALVVIIFRLWISAISSLALGYTQLACEVIWASVDRVACPSDNQAVCYLAKIAVRLDQSEVVVRRPRSQENLEIREKSQASAWASNFDPGTTVACWAPENFKEDVRLDDPGQVDVVEVMWLPLLATVLPCACLCFVIVSCLSPSQKALQRSVSQHYGSEREVYTEGDESYFSTVNGSEEEDADDVEDDSLEGQRF